MNQNGYTGYMISNSQSFSPSQSDSNFTRLVTVAIVTGLVVGLSEFAWITFNYKNEIKKQLAEISQQSNQKGDDSAAMRDRISALESQLNDAKSKTNDNPAISNIDSSISEKAIGYIQAVYEKSGKKYLDIDYIQWLTGEAAITAAMEDKGCKREECIPNGYYIRNRNIQIRTFEISEKATILSLEGDLTKGKVITPKQFLAQFADESEQNQWLKKAPYNIEVASGVVTKISQQYQP